MQKKINPVFFLLLLPWLSHSQQIPFFGTVKIHNSKYDSGRIKYVDFAEVKADSGSAQLALTDAKGEFKLMLIGIKPNSNFNFSVKKNELEVVNIADLSAVAGQSEHVEIYMAEKKYLADFRNRIYQVGKSSSEKALEKKQRELTGSLEKEKAKNERNETQISQLYQELAQVAIEFANADKRANELADKYMRVNLDIASDRYQRAFQFFQTGELEKANILLQESVQNAYSIIEERERINKIRKEADERDSLQLIATSENMEELRLKADQHYSLGEWDSVEVTYELLLKLDSTDFQNLYNAAYFASRQNQDERAVKLYNKAEEYTDSKLQQADVAIELGLLYQKTQSIQAAEINFTSAYEIRKKLAEETNNHQFYASVAAALNNLGNLYQKNNQPALAESYYKDALNIKFELYEKGYHDILPDIALTFNNLGGLYLENQNFELADTLFSNALSTYEDLAKKEPDNYSQHLANSLNNLGNLHHRGSNYEKAESYYFESLKLIRKLIKSNRDAYLPDLVNVLNNIGVIQYEQDKKEAAQKNYREALFYLYELTKTNPSSHYENHGSVLNNLGNLQLTYHDSLIKAEETLTKAYKVYEEAATLNPGYLPDLADMLNNLAQVYVAMGLNAETEARYSEGHAIYSAIKKEDPSIFYPGFVKISRNFGGYYFSIDSTQKAIQYFSEAADELKIIRNENPNQFQYEWATLMEDFAVTHHKGNSFKEAGKYYSEAINKYRILAAQNPEKNNLHLVDIIEKYAWFHHGQFENNYDFSGREKIIENLEESLTLLNLYDLSHPEINSRQTDANNLINYFKTVDEIQVRARPILAKIDELENKNKKERNPKEGLHRVKEIVKLQEELLALKPSDTKNKDYVASGHGNLAWSYLQNNEIKKAEKTAKRGLTFNKENNLSNCTLALALLYRGKWSKTKAVFSDRKTNDPKNWEAWKDVFLKMLGALERGGMTHPNIAKVREYLK